jgi:hypothetical protein
MSIDFAYKQKNYKKFLLIGKNEKQKAVSCGGLRSQVQLGNEQNSLDSIHYSSFETC